MHDFQFEEKYRKDTKNLEQKKRLDSKYLDFPLFISYIKFIRPNTDDVTAVHSIWYTF